MRVGIDTGGTHTDVVLFDEKNDKFFVDKVSTTSDLITGVLNGIKSILQSVGVEPTNLEDFSYSTTAVTNMIVQREKVKVGLITTKGFRDILEIGRAYRDWNIYDIQMDRKEPLVPRQFRKGVTERVDFRGKVIEKLNEDEAREIVRQFIKKGIESIAVVFLHSYRNPTHERRMKEIIQEEDPNILVSLSSEVSPEFREYERTSTTVLNAFVQPQMIRHLNSLREKLRGININCPNYIMQSTGGLTSFNRAQKKPITVGSSGPVAGVLAGRYFGNLAGFSNIITFDMGGTSTDISIIKDNKLSFTIESELDRFPMQIPSVEFNTVGAGGGSIIWIDKGGALRVGPKSAGADPGPACYDQGGRYPTLTDANLVQGVLDPAMFLGGKRVLNKKKAEDAIREVANRANMSVNEVASGAIQVAVSTMADGIKFLSVRKGLDLREFALVAFGGAGPMFASMVAEELGFPAVVIPPNPGVTSAFGLLLADISHEYVITRVVTEDMLPVNDVNDIFGHLEEQAVKEFEQEGIGKDRVIMLRTVDLRYFGQSHELNIPVKSGKLSDSDLVSLRAEFYKKHQEVYGHYFDNKPVQYVKFRVTGVVKKDKPQIRRSTSFSNIKNAKIGSREVRFQNEILKTSIFVRDKLRPGDIVKGPAIIEQMDSTTLLLPEDHAEIDPAGNIIISKR